MKIVTGSNGTKYQVINGTSFHMETDNAVIQVLCDALDTRGHGRSSRRLRLYYGDVETGRDWEEVYEVTGYIGRSTGRIKIPLLIHNTRSFGGGAILDHCIVKIEHSNKRTGGVLYQHPHYHIAA